MSITSDMRRAWAPPCTGPLTRIELHGHGVISVRSTAAQAFHALNAILAKHNYRTRRADTGAYNCRKITGGNNYSLHAYGIAADLNWTTNPYGPNLVTDMPMGMVHEIEALRTNDGHRVFRWGGRYSRNKDAMHYEVICTPAQLATGIRTATIQPPIQPPVISPDEEEYEMQIIVNQGRHLLVWGLWHLNIESEDSDALAFIGVKRKDVPTSFLNLVTRTTVDAHNVNLAAFYAKAAAGA